MVFQNKGEVSPKHNFPQVNKFPTEEMFEAMENDDDDYEDMEEDGDLNDNDLNNSDKGLLTFLGKVLQRKQDLQKSLEKVHQRNQNLRKSLGKVRQRNQNLQKSLEKVRQRNQNLWKSLEKARQRNQNLWKFLEKVLQRYQPNDNIDNEEDDTYDDEDDSEEEAMKNRVASFQEDCFPKNEKKSVNETLKTQDPKNKTPKYVFSKQQTGSKAKRTPKNSSESSSDDSSDSDDQEELLKSLEGEPQRKQPDDDDEDYDSDEEEAIKNNVASLQKDPFPTKGKKSVNETIKTQDSKNDQAKSLLSNQQTDSNKPPQNKEELLKSLEKEPQRKQEEILNCLEKEPQRKRSESSSDDSSDSDDRSQLRRNTNAPLSKKVKMDM